MAASLACSSFRQRSRVSDVVIRTETESDSPLPPSAFSPAIPKTNTFDSHSSIFGSHSTQMERCESLLSDIRKLMTEQIKDPSNKANHTASLSLVDSTISLGISRHFDQEIKEILNLVCRIWKEWETGESISQGNPFSDFSGTALAFKLLRLHRYPDISPDVLMRFRVEAGGGFCGVEIDSVEGVQKAVYLLRASMVRFPGETILEEAEAFASALLNSWLSRSEAYPSSLIAEVKYWLEYPWYMSPPRWQARLFIDILGSNHQWLTLDVNKKMLELAKLDFNILQEMHQQELHEIRKWWDDDEYDLSRLTMVRQRCAESYFFVATSIFEPEFADVRLALAKAVSLVFLVDDMYDNYGTVDQLRIFTDAFRRWDVSVADSLPLPWEMKTAFKFAMRNFLELTEKCNESQTLNTESCIRQRWVGIVESYMRELEWEAGTKTLNGMEEYMRNATESVSLWPLFTIADLLLFNMSTCPDQLKELCQIPPFNYNCAKTIRLLNDIYGSQVELELKFISEEEEEAVSAVTCMIREKPWLSKAEAVEELHSMIKQLTEDISRQYLGEENGRMKDRNRVAWELTRVFQFFYKRRGKYELKDQMRLILLDPILTH